MLQWFFSNRIFMLILKLFMSVFILCFKLENWKLHMFRLFYWCSRDCISYFSSFLLLCNLFFMLQTLETNFYVCGKSAKIFSEKAANDKLNKVHGKVVHFHKFFIHIYVCLYDSKYKHIIEESFWTLLLLIALYANINFKCFFAFLLYSNLFDAWTFTISLFKY